MIDFMTALREARANKAGRGYPGLRDPRCARDVIFPSFTPKFELTFDSTLRVFTIGSCFARNIEEGLDALGVVVPTRGFRVPGEEWHFRRNGLLNEYNPGTIGQRITAALEGRRDSAETLVATANGVADLLLPGGSDVSPERGAARREEIFQVYAQLAASQLVIITLGYIEAWYDHAAKRYLNRMPPAAAGRRQPDRFELRTMTVADSLAALEPAVDALTARGAKVIVTLSPVPISTTFQRTDCVVANEYSKSVLRVVAELLTRDRPNVDYYPSYEIVRSGGLPSYLDDNVHVRNDLVLDIVQYMVASYSGMRFVLPVERRAPWWRKSKLDLRDNAKAFRRLLRRTRRRLLAKARAAAPIRRSTTP